MTPGVAVSPLFVMPTATLSVKGTGFPPGATIDILLDGAAITNARSSSNGAVSAGFAIPAATLPGAHTVTLKQESGDSVAQTAVTVSTNWNEDEFSAAGTAYNPVENVLSPGNVSALALAWSVGLEQYAYPIPAVFNDNVLFTSDYTGKVRAFGLNGALIWTASTGAVLTQMMPLAVDGLVVFASDGAGNAKGGNRLFAFRQTCGTGGATCKPVWTASLPANISGSLSFFGGKIIVPGFDGQVYPVNPATGAAGTPYFAIDKTHGPITTAVHYDQTGGFYYGTPSSFQGKYAKGSGFETLTTGAIFTEAAIFDNVAYYKDSLSNLHQGGSGWSVDLGNPGCLANLAVAYRNVYAGTCHSIGAYATSDGHTVWSAATIGQVQGITLANGVVYACISQALFAYDALTGAQLFAMGDCNEAPVVVNGTVYIGDGGVEAYTIDGNLPNR